MGYTQVEDDAEGPQTKREYEVARVPVGVALSGQVVNFLGCPQGSQIPLGMDAQLPLLNDQLDMKSREQINTPLFTGVKVTCYTCLSGLSDRDAHAKWFLSHACCQVRVHHSTLFYTMKCSTGLWPGYLLVPVAV